MVGIKNSTALEFRIGQGNLKQSEYLYNQAIAELPTENNKGEEIGIEGSIEIIEKSFNKDVKKQLDDITKKVVKVAAKNKLSDDLTLISIGK